MSLSKGPWKVNKIGVWDYSVIDGRKMTIASIEQNLDEGGDGSSANTLLANANLIAAAPELLEALEEAQEFVERYMTSDRDEKLQLKLDLLIKKAKGES